jgi:hypothetical protein
MNAWHWLLSYFHFMFKLPENQPKGIICSNIKNESNVKKCAQSTNLNEIPAIPMSAISETRATFRLNKANGLYACQALFMHLLLTSGQGQPPSMLYIDSLQ